MMVRTGFVKEKKNGLLRVCFERPDACEGCRGCAKGLMPRQELLTVFGQAEAGDIVDVRVPEARTLKASLMAYALPLIGLLGGLAAGWLLGLSEALDLLLALAGLAVGYLAVRAFEMHLRSQPKWRPTVIRIHPKDTKDSEKEESCNE